MGRPLRIEYPGAYYHVFNRGIERRQVFPEAADYEWFLERTAVVHRRYRVILHAYCILPNHYHLLVQTLEKGLHKCMQDLASQYSRHYNGLRKRVGPLFQGRYGAVLIGSDRYVMAVARYIHLNPVKAEIAENAVRYRWSSYGAFMGVRPPEGGLHTDWLLGLHGRARDAARREMRSFTLEEAGEGFDPVAEAKGECVLGDERFIGWLRRGKIPAGSNSSILGLRALVRSTDEVARLAISSAKDVTADARLRRKLMAYGLKTRTGMTLAEVADRVGFPSHFAVGQAIRRLMTECEGDPGLKRVVAAYRKELMKADE